MPLKLYCSKCNEPTEYSLQKPKFCSICGKNFAEVENINLAKKNIALAQKSLVIDDNDDNKDINIELPDKLEIEFERFENNSNNGGIKLSDIGLQQKTGFKRPKLKKVNQKEQIQRFREQAGLGGKKPIIVEDSGAE